MTSLAATPAGARKLIWLLVAAALLIVAGANVHLVYVAFTSQPDCIDHVKRGVSVAEAGRFSAASSSCTPRP